MSRLSRYVLFEVTPPVVLATCFFTMVMLIVQMLKMTNLLVRAGIGFGLLGEVLLMVAITVLAMTLPMGILLGTLVGIGRLAGENELLAIRAAGINPLRVMTPLVGAAGLVAVGLMVVNVEVIPRFSERISAIRTQLQHDILTNLQPGRVYDELGTRASPLVLVYDARGSYDSDDVLLPMERVNLRGRVPNPGVDPLEMESGRGDLATEFIVFARQGAVLRDEETGYLDLLLRDGTFVPIGEAERGDLTASVVRFGELRTSFSSRALESAGNLPPRALRQHTLREMLANPPVDAPLRRGDGRMTREWTRHFEIRNELFQRFTMPLATIAFVLMAIPIAMEVRSAARSVSMLIAMGLLLVYYVLMTFGQNIGASGAGLAMTVFGHLLPVVVVSGAGVFLLIRVSRK